MNVFLDFEASSLGKNSFPIEVAWVFEDGRSKSMLIQPLPQWTDWSDAAEALHGISRETLAEAGTPPAGVARQMIDTLTGHALYASAPSWDGKWMSTLLRAGGFPRHALTLRRSDEAFVEAAREVCDPHIATEHLQALVQDIIKVTQPESPTHRALADADLELHRLRRVRDAAGHLKW